MADSNPDARAQRARPIYEHPWAVRFSHWANAVTVTVLAMSGLQIFNAFPSFGPKIPQENLIDAVPEALALGGWLGGALQWHFTFMWIFAGAGLLYVVSQIAVGPLPDGAVHAARRARRVADGAALLPVRPEAAGHRQYNPLQKLAYTSTLAFGALSLLTGLVMYKPVQFSAAGLAVWRLSTAPG